VFFVQQRRSWKPPSLSRSVQDLSRSR
jgi:hypothetical protein